MRSIDWRQHGFIALQGKQSANDQIGQVSTLEKDSSNGGQINSRRTNTWQLPNSVVKRGAWAVKPRNRVNLEERACAAGYRSQPRAKPFGRMTALCAVSISILKMPRVR